MERSSDNVVRCSECGHPTQAPHHTGPGSPFPECDCCTWRRCAEGTCRTDTGEETRETAPQRVGTAGSPPPGWAPEKWAALSRRERRSVMRHPVTKMRLDRGR